MKKSTIKIIQIIMVISINIFYFKKSSINRGI